LSIKKLGEQTLKYKKPPIINSYYSIVGPKEGKGPLGNYFDMVLDDDLIGQKSWEKAERKMMFEASINAIKKSKFKVTDIDFFIAGDLLNQIISSSFAAKDLQIPFLGIYGACSTFCQGLIFGSVLIDGGFANNVLVATSSHFCTAERQYRYPLELGNQRPPTSQWTVTGSGAVVLSNSGKGLKVTYSTPGKILDFGLKDPNDMGSAMAPAAAHTIIQHFKDTGFTPKDYDLIVTGDLGVIGKDIALEIISNQGYDINNVFSDCGTMIFTPSQDTHSGGSGCACSAVVSCGYIFREMERGIFTRVLIVATGAMLSKASYLQGESIPCIANAVTIESK